MEALQAHINGTLRTATENFGNWQTYSGGRISGEVAETRDPGAKYARKIPAPGSIENVTLTRDYDPTRDGAAYDRLEALRGTNETFTVGKVIRDGAGNVVRIETRVGIVQDVMGPEGDTNGGTNKGTLEVVIGING